MMFICSDPSEQGVSAVPSSSDGLIISVAVSSDSVPPEEVVGDATEAGAMLSLLKESFVRKLWRRD